MVSPHQKMTAHTGTNPLVLSSRSSNHAREQMTFGFFVGMFFVLTVNHSWSWVNVWTSSVKSFSGRPKIVLIGDSITEYGFSQEGGWAAMVSDHLTCRVDVINRGYSGWTTNFFRQVMGSVLDRQLFRGSVAVTLFLGANDACLREKAPTLHVSLDEYKVHGGVMKLRGQTEFFELKLLENLKILLHHVMGKGVKRDHLILIPPPPIVQHPCPFGGRRLCPPARKPNVTKQYYDASLEVAKELSVDYIEHWEALNHEEMLMDGLHFSQKGSRTLYELLKPKIEARTSHLRCQVPLAQDMTRKEF